MQVDGQLNMHNHLCVACEPVSPSSAAAPHQATGVGRLQQGASTAETRIASANLDRQLQALELGTSAKDPMTKLPAMQADCNTADIALHSTDIASSNVISELTTTANKAVNQSNCMCNPATALLEGPLDTSFMPSSQPACNTNAAQHSSKHEHESSSLQRQREVPTPGYVYGLLPPAVLTSSQSPATSMDHPGYSAVDLLSMISDKGSQGNDSPLAFPSPLVSLKDHAMCSVQAAASSPVTQQHDVHSMCTSAMSEPERQQGDSELPTSAEVASLPAADLQAPASTSGSNNRQSTAAPMYGTAGQKHGSSDDEEVECSKRRLSAGTERRVHVAEQLRQMLQEAPKLLSNPSDIVSATSLCIGPTADQPSQFRPQSL